MILYSSVSPSNFDEVSIVTNFPCNDFLGITYSEIGAKSSRASASISNSSSLVEEERECERDRDLDCGGDRNSRSSRALDLDRDLDLEVDCDIASSPVRDLEVMRSSGT